MLWFMAPHVLELKVWIPFFSDKLTLQEKRFFFECMMCLKRKWMILTMWRFNHKIYGFHFVVLHRFPKLKIVYEIRVISAVTSLVFLPFGLLLGIQAHRNFSLFLWSTCVNFRHIRIYSLWDSWHIRNFRSHTIN